MHKPDAKFAGLYRRTVTTLKAARYVLLIVFIAFCVYCIGFFRDNITMDNLRYLFKYINLSYSDSTPSDATITVNTEENSEFLMLHNDLAVVSNSGCELYDFAGNKLYSYDYAYSNAAFSTNGKNILVYDTAGTELAIYSSVSKIYQADFDYKIKSAYINDMGYFAVINAEKTYRSGVIVFDRDGNEMFRWMTPDKYITGVALNSNASEVICSAVYNKSGEFVTELSVYSTSTGQKLYTYTANDALGIKLGISNNKDRIYLLTDSSFMCFDNQLQGISSIPYRRNNAKFFKEFEDCFIIAESNNLSGSSMTVSAYNYNAEKMFELETDSKVIDAAFYDSTLYILTKDEMSVYDYGNSEDGTELYKLASLELDRQYKAIRTDEYGRYILVSAKTVKRGSLAALLETELE